MKPSRLERDQLLPGDVERVFAFFADPWNLEAITPPWLRFRVVRTSTPEIEEGTEIDYRLRLRGVPVRWRSRITSWNPPYGFVDEQLVGPYRSWVHRHSFTRVGDEVLVTDRVDYEVPGGSLVERWLVRPDLERIFDFRRDRLELLLGRAHVESVLTAAAGG